MLAQGKTPKVLIATARWEPIVNIPEGSDHAVRCRPLQGP